MQRLLFLLVVPLGLRAQAVPRADTPPKGTLRLTIDPLIDTWDEWLIDGRRVRLSAALDGDTVGDAYIPLIARLEADVRTAGASQQFQASLGRTLFALRHERRTTPLRAELGVTNRLAVGFRLPLVRVMTRVHLALDTTSSNLGLNPLLADANNRTAYATFFGEFDTALQQLDQNIQAGFYGCPASPQCAGATALLADARAVRDALNRSVYGAGAGGGAPFLPRAGSSGGTSIAANVQRIQQDLANAYQVTGFTAPFLTPIDPVDAAAMAAALGDTTYGFGVAPFATTPRWLRFWPGDAELDLRYRLIARPAYGMTLGGVVRLPTGHLDSPHDATDVATGDGQMDIEAQVVQELLLFRRLWLNLSVRGGVQRAGERDRRLAPAGIFLAPRGAAARLRWDPGDYVAADFAPLVRFADRLAAGVTVGYWSRARDQSAFLSAEDSLAVAARLGEPVSASLVDRGTDVRVLRLGVVASYVGPNVEGGLSVERTANAWGGTVARTTTFRIVMRVSRRLF